MRQSIFLEVAILAAKKAEEVILKYYHEGFDVDFKSDNSPVTIADKEAEKIIIETIKARFPDHGFICEESGATKGTSEYVWIIDPIDGTKAFIRGLPYFATEIGLMKGDELVVGVSNGPALKSLAYAEKGAGAYLNDKQVHVSSVSKLENAYISPNTLRGFEKINKIPNLVSLAQQSFSCRSYTTNNNDNHWLIAGKIDGVISAGISIWDVAAMSVIIQEAGGEVTDFYGNPITKDVTTFLATNGLLHDAIVGFFRDEN